MLDLIVDPDAFFEREAENPDVVVGAVLVLLAGVTTVTSQLLLLDPVMQAPFPQDSPISPGQIRQITYVTAAIGVVVTLVYWVVATGIAHLVATQGEGEGEFTDALALTGYGYVATIVAGLVSLGGMYVALQAAGDPAAAQNIFEFQRAISQHPAVRFSFVPAILLLLWQGLLWTFAVKHAYGVTRNDAAIAAAGPVVLAVLWKLVGPVLQLVSPF